MLNKTLRTKRKAPVPVVLTGKIWVPSPVEPTKFGKHFGLAVGLILCLAPLLFWLVSSGTPTIPQLLPPASTIQLASSATISSAIASIPNPDKIASAIVSTTIAASQPQPVGVDTAPGSSPVELSSSELFVAARSRFFSSTDVKSLPPKKLPPKEGQSEKPEEKPLATPAAKLVTKPEEKPVATPAAKLVTKPEEKPIEKPGEKTQPAAAVVSLDQEISSVPSRKKRSRVLVGLRSVLKADGWNITWVNLEKGVSCRNDAGSSLIIIPGNKRALLNGKPVFSPVRPIVTKDGQLFVPIELLNKILDGRLSIVGGRSSSKELKIRLASRTPVTTPRDLPGIAAIRRKGHLMISLRQVLEADGWKVTWEGRKMGAICRKGETQVFVVVPGKTRSQLNGKTIKNKRAPVLYRGKFLVATDTLEKVLKCRIALLGLNKRSHEAEIRISGG